VTTPPRLTLEQYVAFVGGKPLEQLGPFLPVSPPVVVTQQEKDTLLATITTRKVADFTGTVVTLNLALILHSSPFTCSFQADQVSPLS